MGRVIIGISGWNYPEWRGVFYPKGLTHKRELGYLAEHFPSIEINGTFYSLKRPPAFKRWHAETPPGFTFAIKGSRYITHMRKLRDVQVPLANFFGQGVLALEEKLGPILWQFPRMQKYERERFERFFAMLPRTRKAAAKLAESHDDRLSGRSLTEVATNSELVHTVEVRHESFDDDDFYALLREQNIGLVVSDSPMHWPLLTEVTRDVVYMRLHGDVELYASGYTRASLSKWAARIRKASEVADVYVYFDNDKKVFAPRDAELLMGILGLRSRSAASRANRSRGKSSPDRAAGTAR
jgi:uncharacterized protein YecE (DUF72 family)